MVYDNTEEVVGDDNRYVKVATGMIVARDLQALNEYKKKKEVVDKEKGVDLYKITFQKITENELSNLN